MKKSLCLCAFVSLCLFVTGCGVLHIPGKLTAVTLFKDIEIDEVYIADPNAVMWITNYAGDAADARFRYNPLTKSFEAVLTESEKKFNHEGHEVHEVKNR